jgi:hypothetical protein
MGPRHICGDAGKGKRRRERCRRGESDVLSLPVRSLASVELYALALTLSVTCHLLIRLLQDGWTALQEAMSNGDDNIVEMLVDAGADMNVNAVNKVGVLFHVCACAALRL